MSARRTKRRWLLVSAALLGGSLFGCQSSQRETAPQPTTAPADRDARLQESMTGSDAERAKAALERDWPRGERRPTTPPRRPPVDQPRPSRR